MQYQNANNSVRVNDEFMRAVRRRARSSAFARAWTARSSRPSTRASLMRKIATRPRGSAPTRAFSTTTRSTTGTPTLRPAGSPRPTRARIHVARQLLVQPGLAEPAEVPQDDDTFDAAVPGRSPSSSSPRWTSRSASRTSRPRRSGHRHVDYRQLGIGYANLGALLMATGHGYDSDGGRALAAAITSLLTGAPTSGPPSWPGSSARMPGTPGTRTPTSG